MKKIFRVTVEGHVDGSIEESRTADYFGSTHSADGALQGALKAAMAEAKRHDSALAGCLPLRVTALEELGPQAF